MITMYTGLPGSGKSLHMAETIYNALKSGKNVVANFEINLDYFNNFKHPEKLGEFIYVPNYEWMNTADRSGKKLSYIEALYRFGIDFSKKDDKGHIIEGQHLLVLDECQLMFNARTWNQADRKLWVAFFTEHRKYGYEVYLVTQDENYIDKQIRTLVEYRVLHRKVTSFKGFGKFLSLVRGNFVAITYYAQGNKRAKASNLGHRFYRGKKFYNFYDSYKMFAVRVT